LAAGLLFVCLTAVYYDVMFLGRSVIMSNLLNPLDPRPLRQNYGPAMMPPVEWSRRNLYPFPNLRDPLATWSQWEPSWKFFKRALERREWPLWNPYIAGGTPAMANLLPQFFFPPYTLTVLLGGSMRLFNWYFLLLLWSAAFFTFLFLRRHELTFVASLAGGIIVLMSGMLNQNLGSILMQPLACLPLALYATRVFLDRPDSRRTAVLALVYAMIALASFPPLLLGVFGITTVYVLVAIILGDAPRARVGLLWTGAVLLGLGLVAFYYGSYLALREMVPEVAKAYRLRIVLPMPLINIYQLLSPTIMGGVQVYTLGPFATPPGPPHIPYLGMVAVIGVLLAWPVGGRRTVILYVASAIAATAILLKLFGVPPVDWIRHIRVFNEIHYSGYFGMPLGFPLATLAALGIERVARGALPRLRVAIVAIGAIAITESAWRIANGTGLLGDPSAHFWIRDWKVLAMVTLLAVTLLAWPSITQPRAAARLCFTGALAAVAALEGIYNNTYPHPKVWDTFANPVPYVELLQRTAGLQRVLAFGQPAPNCNEAFEIFSLDSNMTYNPPRLYELYRRHTGSSITVFVGLAQRIPPEPVLDRANVAFLVVESAYPGIAQEAQARGYRKRFDDGFIRVFERATLPRFFYSSEYRMIPASVALDAVATAPSRVILLEEDPGVASTPNTAGDPDVRVEAYHRNSTTLIVDAPRPGLVYASESFFGGWTAVVNGVPARIQSANYAFRAVAVPAGHSRIEFRYWPPGLTAGLATSGVSVAILFGLITVRVRERV